MLKVAPFCRIIDGRMRSDAVLMSAAWVASRANPFIVR